MSRENLHVSEYFANLWEICVLVKKRYYSSFASRSHIFSNCFQSLLIALSLSIKSKSL